MPKIKLKPNSPDYIDPTKRAGKTKFCDMPYCEGEGTFRAPKDRSLSDHYWFCQMHITEYNRAWNFFEGMNQREVEEQILKSMFGDRPTWRYDADGMAEENLRRQAYEFHGTGDTDERSSRAWKEYEENKNQVDQQGAEFEAMVIFGLEPPVDLDKIKARYKQLAKNYHPDLNKDNPQAEELLKKVNMAYTVLKLAYQKFDDLEKQTQSKKKNK
jgi:DnaJ-domain-containing protein 1